jgi:hypothetical protein
MSQTMVDEANRTFLVLRLNAARDNSEFTDGEASWCAHVCDPASPLAGLYAFGPSLTAVRDAVATLAWAAVTAGELVPFGIFAADLAGIHVAVTTAAEYDAAWLAASVANDAA